MDTCTSNKPRCHSEDTKCWNYTGMNNAHKPRSQASTNTTIRCMTGKMDESRIQQHHQTSRRYSSLKLPNGRSHPAFHYMTPNIMFHAPCTLNFYIKRRPHRPGTCTDEETDYIALPATDLIHCGL